MKKRITNYESRITMRSGFTLLEMSVVLAIVAVVLGGAIALFTASLAGQQYQVTLERMKIIDRTLQDYWLANKRLPCPYDTTVAIANVAFGFDTNAAGAGCAANREMSTAAANGVVYGGVPIFTLGLPYDMAFDGWGRRINYAVNADYTDAAPAPQDVGAPAPIIEVRNINDAATNIAGAAGAAYVVLSKGANGHGASSGATGARISSANTNALELANCDCDNTGAVAGNLPADPIFYQGPETINGATNVFDDIVVFKTRAQLRLPTE